MGIGDRRTVREYAETTSRIPGVRSVAGAAGRLIAANPLAGLGPDETGIAALEAASKRRRKHLEAPEEVYDITAVGRPEPKGIAGLEWSPVQRPEAQALPGPGGGVAGSEARMSLRRAAAGITVDPPSAPKEGAKDGGKAPAVQQAVQDRWDVPGHEEGDQGGYIEMAGGKGLDPDRAGKWLRSQAGRQQGPQVYGFDASEIPPAPKPSGGIAAAVEPTSDEQGAPEASLRPAPPAQPPDERDRGVWGIPQGIRRSPAPPGAQARWQSEFQDAEKARYARRDTEDAGIAAEMARRQALTEDPFAEQTAQTAGQKELLGAEFEGQAGLFGAREEAEYATEEKRGKAYELGANIEQDRYQGEVAKIEASDMDEKAKASLLEQLQYEHGIKMQVLQARHFQEQGLQYGLRYGQDSWDR